METATRQLTLPFSVYNLVDIQIWQYGETQHANSEDQCAILSRVLTDDNAVKYQAARYGSISYILTSQEKYKKEFEDTYRHTKIGRNILRRKKRLSKPVVIASLNAQILDRLVEIMPRMCANGNIVYHDLETNDNRTIHRLGKIDYEILRNLQFSYVERFLRFSCPAISKNHTLGLGQALLHMLFEDLNTLVLRTALDVR